MLKVTKTLDTQEVCRGREYVPSGQQGTPDTQRLEDEGPHKQLTISRSWCMGNGQRGPPAILTHGSLQPQKKVPTLVLSRARH